MQRGVVEAVHALGRGEVLAVSPPPSLSPLFEDDTPPTFADLLHHPLLSTESPFKLTWLDSHIRLWSRQLSAEVRTFSQASFSAVSEASPLNNWLDSLFDSTRSAPVPVMSHKVALPPDGFRPMPLEPYLPPELRQWWDSPTLFVDPPVAARVRPFHNVPDSEYVPLLTLLQSRNMISFTPDPPRVINGMFGVPKGVDEIRLIYDCRPANVYLDQLPRVELPTPACLERLPAWVSFLVKCDLSSYYHTLAVPAQWRTFFGFRAVRGADVGLPQWPKVYPVAHTLPMGFRASVVLGQQIHKQVLQPYFASMTARFGCQFIDLMDEQAVLHAKPGAVLYLVYLDDVVMFSNKDYLLNALLDALVSHYRRVGLLVKESKVQRPSTSGVVLGVFVALDARLIRPTEANLAWLWTAIPEVLVSHDRTPTLAMLERLVGKATWALLTRRPLFSILSSTYAFLERFRTLPAGTTMRMWPGVVDELYTLWSLLPVVHSRFGSHLASQVWATDAQGPNDLDHGGIGVVRTEAISAATVWLCLEDSLPTPVTWNTMLSMRFRHYRHVNEAETLALVQTLIFALQDAVDRRHVILSDNEAAIGCLRKGRSSSPRMLPWCRLWCALLLNHDSPVPFLRYIPSALNPADGPSRSLTSAIHPPW